MYQNILYIYEVLPISLDMIHKTTTSFSQLKKSAVLTWIGCGFVCLVCACDNSTSDSIRAESSDVVVVDEQCDEIATEKTNSLHLLSGDISFVTEGIQRLQEEIASPIEVIPDFSKLINHHHTKHINYHFAFHDVAFCAFSAKANLLIDKIHLSGRWPTDLSLSELEALSWSEEDTKILAGIEKKREKCIFQDQDQRLIPAWKINFIQDGLPYESIVYQSNIYSTQAKFFDVSEGAARIFAPEPANSTTLVLKTFPLIGLSDGGTLCNSLFKTIVNKPFSQAQSSTHEYFYAVTDPKFNEASVFTNASNYGDWLLTHKAFIDSSTQKAKWPGKRIELTIYAETDASNYLNTMARYFPPSEEITSPTIKLGFGDLKILKNLHYEPEVIAHEIGHHIIYQSITEFQPPEALRLHEGLADFLVMAQTNNTCLGENICPPTSSTCFLPPTCLRNADNSISYSDLINDPVLSVSAHKASQFISGLMWDIGKVITLDKATEILLKAVHFFDADASFTQFIDSLMQADKALYNGENACSIQTAAYNRGLEARLKAVAIDCKNYSP